MVDVINYVSARGRVFFSERSERRLGMPAEAVGMREHMRTEYPFGSGNAGWGARWRASRRGPLNPLGASRCVTPVLPGADSRQM